MLEICMGSGLRRIVLGKHPGFYLSLPHDWMLEISFPGTAES